MSNADTDAAWRYHDETKHSYEKVRASRHYLDWGNRPIPYKIYTSLEPVRLPEEFPPSQGSALDAIADVSQDQSGKPASGAPDIQTLAGLCYFSNGITKRISYPGGEMAFRAAACTGALYHIELYLVCGDLPGLQAGVYHFGAHDFSLRQLRPGDFRRVLADASGNETSVARAAAVVICTSTFWRNAWKYQARAYRHTFWDNGTVLANLLAVAAGIGLPARLVLGFADETVCRLLDVDPSREAVVSLVALGSTPPAAVGLPPAPAVAPLGLPTAPLSRTEVDYPAISLMHAASCLSSGAEAAAWRSHAVEPRATPRVGPLISPKPFNVAELPSDSIEAVVRRRGSSRRFTHEPISFEQLSTLLLHATGGLPADYAEPRHGLLNEAYLIVNAVGDLKPGAYVFHCQESGFERLRIGDFRQEAGRLALGQDLAADAAVNVYFLADLRTVLGRFGNRGYRAAQLTAAVAAGRLYLAAYALGLGATGLTFFDDEVTEFFSPHAAGKSVMFLLALGRPLIRKKVSD